jgi:hypothetical protein
MIDTPRCYERHCIHFRGVSDSPEVDQVPICVAFPKGIPAEIAYGDNPHEEPFEGDGGIRFEMLPS